VRYKGGKMSDKVKDIAEEAKAKEIADKAKVEDSAEKIFEEEAEMALLLPF